MSCEEWVAHHRCQGHNPHPAPTKENPERWDCDCGGINRILTVEQIAKKFAHWNGGTDRPGMSDSLRHYVLPKDDPVARGKAAWE